MKIATINKNNNDISLQNWEADEGTVAIKILLHGYYYNQTGDWLALATY